MKRYFLTVSFLWIVAVLSAQNPAAKPAVKPTDASAKEEFSLFSRNTWMGRFQKQQHKMVEKLGLDEAQKRSLDTMNDIYVTKRAAFFDDSSIDRRDRKADIKQLQKERYAKFQNILTPEQLQKWDEMRKGQKKKVFRKK